MEGIGTQALDLDIGKRLVIIVVFLSVLWFLLNYLATKIKSGEMKLPELFKNKFYGSDLNSKEVHKIELVQKKYLADGCEMLVVDVDGRHVLLARNINGSIAYVKDLDNNL